MDSMYKLAVAAVLLTAVVHGAPTNRNCIVDNLSSMKDALNYTTQKFYCNAFALQLHATFMEEERNAIVVPNNASSSFEHENVGLILEQFDFTCKMFTTVLALKHQLQQSLFNGNYFIMNNDTLDQVNDGDLKNFTVVLHYLQALADVLQDIEGILTSKQCIEFSSDQYKIAYCSFISDDNNCTDDSSVIYTLVDSAVKMSKVGEYPSEWRHHNTLSPDIDLCNGTSIIL